ncbi:hypothetical protein ACJX0J_030663, partial [Zea mays]
MIELIPIHHYLRFWGKLVKVETRCSLRACVTEGCNQRFFFKQQLGVLQNINIFSFVALPETIGDKNRKKEKNWLQYSRSRIFIQIKKRS